MLLPVRMPHLVAVEDLAIGRKQPWGLNGDVSLLTASKYTEIHLATQVEVHRVWGTPFFPTRLLF